MTVGNKGGSMSEPNIVPLIDVLLVLIIIFMVINPPNPQGLKAIVPQPNPNQQPNQDVLNKTIIVQVTATGDVMINQDKTVTWDNLGSRLEQIFAQRADKVAFVKGDDNVEFAPVAKAISIMHGAGIDHIGLIPTSVEQGK
ncbi:MAG TPA: biopolymer transporter ExbD [Candidatus Acidoferrales bacterium]|nr:biopolymer transporter ExbD [Candidatus Acidoferrales bacterium]